MLTFGSLFAGVGGFDLGFEQAGFSCGFQVEWDKDCQQTLAHHWPDVPRWSDVRDVNGAELPPVDVITYGFPCQDLSVAGKRAGLDGNRSGLFFQAVRIITEMREATNGRYPTWAVAENVAGLLNADNGHAMGRCVDELAEAGSLVIEWCLVDAQWFGVPQRRRRVFLASCFNPATAARCPDPLFPIGESGSRNPTPSQQERKDTATTSPQSTQTDSLQRMTDIPTTFATICAQDATKWGSNQWVDEGKAIIERNATGPLTTGSPGRIRGTETLDSGHIIPIAFSHTQGLDPQASDHHFPTLRSNEGGQAVAQPVAYDEFNDSLSETHQTLRSGTKQSTGVVTPDLAVRRLTPIECERLMGWPDDHTLHRADGKPNSDSTRYRMCGNGVAAPVAKWIAKQLRPLL
jgi:DNA (cytosine-5)-methyltransferase 1